jgi:predicted Fe-Mo cluster-binding NifX family protein
VFPHRLFDLLPQPVIPLADATAGGTGKLIAVAALSLDESAEISVHAGHAPNFLLFDDSGDLRTIIANPYVNLHEDTAHRVADLLSAHNVRLMIAGDFGPHVAKALDEKGIRHIKDMGLANIAVSAHRKD